MRGYATMLEMVGELNDQQTNYVGKIVSGVESMSRLVTNLLDLGRIEAGIGLQVDMVHVPDVIERVVSALQLEASQKHIQVNMEISEDTSPLIEADQALLQQAIHNLVENAIKYTPAQGKVNIRMWPKQDRMVIEVRDTGSGISPMDQPRLFEKFYRGAQQGSKEQHGTGLGLAIVKSIAERHGGQVWVESQLGKGSAFFLAIPLHQATPEVAKS
jgi:signal transduction histidine kinase